MSADTCLIIRIDDSDDAEGLNINMDYDNGEHDNGAISLIS